MPYYRMPDGTPVHLNFGTGKRSANAPRACQGTRPDETICGWIAVYECDWKVGGGKTCDRPICRSHALLVDTDKHLCPAHQEKYLEWKKRKEAKPNAAQDLPRV